jgi:hypothetical protein
VAENQPGKTKNRMNNEFKDFTARLRKIFDLAERAAVVAKPLECGVSRRFRATPEHEISFNSLALELFALQFNHNESYRRLCEARGATPERIKKWDQIPAVPTSAFKELELSCLPVAERTTVFHSSGTTEHRPSRHYHNAESLAIYEASLLAGFPLGKKEGQLIILTPPPEQAPHSSLVYMFEILRRRFGFDHSAFTGLVDHSGGWLLDLGATIEAIRQAEHSGQPLLLLGTAFSYVHLLDSLAKRSLKFELPAGSRAMETGGYKGRSRVLPKAELHSLITRRLGISSSHILCEYGMSELSSQAYDVGTKNGDGRTENDGGGAGCFHFPLWVRVQIISPETGLEVPDGETGLIRVFDLANVYSVMAVQTEDLALRRGDGFELLGRAAKSEPRGCSLQAV